MDWISAITAGDIAIYLLLGAVTVYLFGYATLRYERPVQLVVLIPWLLLQVAFCIVIWPLFALVAIRGRIQ